MKKTFAAAVIAITAVLAMTGAAFALSAAMGNDATDRATADTWQNFTIVDKNNPAPFDGTIASINYFAERAGTIRFVLVDSADTITWVSDEIVAAGGAGTATLTAPAGVTAGSNLGVYSKGAGVISFDYDASAEPAMFEDRNSGVPTVGETLAYVGSDARIYSMNASVRAASPDLCKNGGWENYPEYKNQGQCIASIVADENAGK